MGFLTGKRAVIAGIASDRSIAWGIAQAMAREGAEIALTYQSERLAERVREMAAEIGASICLPLDVSSDEEIMRMYESLAGHWPSFDILVHSVAFAPREQLVGRDGVPADDLVLPAGSRVRRHRATPPWLPGTPRCRA